MSIITSEPREAHGTRIGKQTILTYAMKMSEIELIPTNNQHKVKK